VAGPPWLAVFRQRQPLRPGRAEELPLAGRLEVKEAPLAWIHSIELMVCSRTVAILSPERKTTSPEMRHVPWVNRLARNADKSRWIEFSRQRSAKPTVHRRIDSRPPPLPECAL